MLPHLSDSICFQRKRSVIYPVPVLRPAFPHGLAEHSPVPTARAGARAHNPVTHMPQAHKASCPQGSTAPEHGTHSRESTTLEWPKAWLRSCYNTDHRQGNILIQYFSMYGTEESQNTIHTGLVKQQTQPPSGFCNRQSHVRKGSAAASHSLSHQCGTFRQPDEWFSKLE